MSYRLVASDFDDTLVPIGAELSARNRDAIARVRAAGVHFVLASGRSPFGLKANASRHGIDFDGLHLICYNGALVVQAWDEQPLFSHRLDPQLARDAARLASGFDVALMVPEGPDVFTNRPDDFSVGFETRANHTRAVFQSDMAALDFVPAKLMMGGKRDRLEEVAAALQSEYGDVAEVLFSADFLLEFNAKGITKGEGLAGLCAALSLDVAASVAIGDNYNDLTMIQTAGLGVAVANAVPGVLAAADRVTVSAEQDAVATLLDELFPA